MATVYVADSFFLMKVILKTVSSFFIKTRALTILFCLKARYETERYENMEIRGARNIMHLEVRLDDLD